MSKRIKIYQHPNEPYIDSLQKGANESPAERFDLFFKNQIKFKLLMGYDLSVVRKIVIKKVGWI